jgi:formylglycine-generating enzyme required for sulfatase activity
MQVGARSGSGENQMPELCGRKRDMVWVPPGPFLYGDAKACWELPGFWIDRTPVTNAAYRCFIAANRDYPVPFGGDAWSLAYSWDRERRTFPPGREHHPVTPVAWYDVLAYAEWAGGRVPTEPEWEKAARGTDGRKYPWGNWDQGRCNTLEAGLLATTPVAHFSPRGDSPYGCADMAGNVWEWATTTNGRRWVVRGGSFVGDRLQARCAFHDWDLADSGIRLYGFRLVADAGAVTLVDDSGPSDAPPRDGRGSLI